MTEKELESLRSEAIRQLEQEQQDRNAKLAELRNAIAELEAADSASSSALLRAQEPFTDASKCVQCWVWRGERVDLKPIASDDDNWDRFRCSRGHEFEFPTS